TTWPIDVLQRWKRFGVDESYLTDPTLITCLVGIRLTPLLCPEGVARMNVQLNLFTHFGNHIAVFGRRVIVEVDVQHRHHFVGR
ncbi:hypothetical protein MJM83_34365, partial [Salmonella enterica subsp. enterica serovar Montevideo]|nr:hypothetical protein [Salmonella enterica subsp. enterica serovar Montevideo]